ncbi:hypothetical protein [Tautonia sociabilis]|uniref:Uncharacterized protein n=1 Tax=Tautonia sociabilis TaxID=2080755 RepID=A0A432MED9_9BACT|nr:hypothetical protein [Tautonia sociabilis]RUL83658.1 hypothetical protein TsocGM_21740 [Tautonia sociabilis]
MVEGLVLHRGREAWAAAVSAAGLAAASGRWRPARVRAPLAGIRVPGRMLGSIRRRLAEAARVDRIGGWDGRFFFREGVAWAPLLVLAILAALVLGRAAGRRGGG